MRGPGRGTRRSGSPTRRAVGRALAATLALLVVGICAPQTPAAAEESPDDGAVQELAERHVPVVMTVRQDAPCDPDGEPFAPTSVDIVLDNPEVALRQVSPGDPVATRAPSARELFDLNDGFHLDFPGGSLSPGCTYEQDFDKYSQGRAPVVYAHVLHQPDQPDRLFLQYWFFWYFNDWNNTHEGDWEGIVLEFDASSPEEALAQDPVAVGYAQHEGGERATWSADKLERDGDRPVVYSSRGSHASYFGAAVYLGRGPSEGFGCDDTDGPHDRLDPEVVVLPDEVGDADDPLAWLGFDGRWGERQSGPFNGPTGPTDKDRWLDSAGWFDDLRSSSVVIPAGDSNLAAVVGTFCDVVEAGSSALITAKVSPLALVLALVVLVLVARFLADLTDWSPIDGSPLVRRRRVGQILRGAGREYRAQPVLALTGLVYLPALALTGLLLGVLEHVPLAGSFVSLVATSGATNLLLAVLVGSIANIAAFVLTSAVVAAHLGAERSGLDGLRAALRTVSGRAGGLTWAFVVSFVPVFALLASGIGAPIGLWLLVRLQLVPQAVGIEGSLGVRALARSSDLVRRRWFLTALVTLLANGVVVASALVLSLLLLVVTSSVPLWAFAVLDALVFAAAVPYAAIAMTLLYGDSVAATAVRDETSIPA